MKLKEKTRVGGKYRKRYDKPRTPADRMLEWEGISPEKAAWLRKQKRELNPFELQEQVETALKQTFWSVLQPDVEMDWEEALQAPHLPPDRPQRHHETNPKPSTSRCHPIWRNGPL